MPVLHGKTGKNRALRSNFLRPVSLPRPAAPACKPTAGCGASCRKQPTAAAHGGSPGLQTNGGVGQAAGSPRPAAPACKPTAGWWGRLPEAAHGRQSPQKIPLQSLALAIPPRFASVHGRRAKTKINFPRASGLLPWSASSNFPLPLELRRAVLQLLQTIWRRL
ncbi:MAG: hypothetical protein Pg6A_09140 [Termitinemataceae bacterium]|nr:MAG: hypothetical protein Pg6A_09140 [Termitinemataceae bacterium]